MAEEQNTDGFPSHSRHESPFDGFFSQRPENDRVTDAKPRRTEKPFFPKNFHHLACRADARKRFEELGNRFPDLCVGVEHDVAGLVVDEARGQGAAVLPASRLVEDSATQPGFENVKFGLAHGSL